MLAAKSIIALVLVGTLQAKGEDSTTVRITSKGDFIQSKVQFRDNLKVAGEHQHKDILEINENVREVDLVDGDIISHETRNAITDTTKYWTSTIIPVAYGPTLPLLNIAGIEEARLEYEMRTCLSFVDRTDEEDYIIFQLRSGCYSSVGKVGGAQTISIGYGCDWRSVVQHEMMHAIGIYHEQSRPDRDNYVRIQAQNIDLSKLNNFVKYDYKTVDDRRVPYDYESVMHYDDSGFSNNGEKTILTRDPAFQGVIGQRRTFSIGDVDMINRMYPCGDPLRHSYSCNFEEENVCGYIQDEKNDDINFVRAVISETPQLATDNSYGEKGKGTAMMLDSSKGLGVANMISMRLHTNATTQCLHFSYYMNLATNSKGAGISASLATIDETTGAIVSTVSLVTISEDHGDYWNLERITIQAPAKHYKLVFSAKNGGKDDVIAVDDILIQDKPCDSAFVQIHNWSDVLASTTNKTGFKTDPIYTDAGYAFKLLIYPDGHPSGTEGYMALFFGLTAGVNDDELEWPFTNQVIRLQMEDQNSNVLLRMSQFIQYISDDNEEVWGRPEPGEDGLSYGYFAFMKIEDIMKTRDFLKNDAIVISVNIRDMRNYSPS